MSQLKRLPPRPQPPLWQLDPLILAALVGAVIFAGAMGGALGAGLMATIAIAIVGVVRQHGRHLEFNRIQQENLQHFLVSNASAEEIATLRGGGELSDKGLSEFLTALKATYGGGEAIRGTARLAGEDQTEAVAPGIHFTLAHDLGWWYAGLKLNGECGRQFLSGEYTQWKARGHTPEEAIEAMIKRVGASRQQKMIQDYAAKLVREND